MPSRRIIMGDGALVHHLLSPTSHLQLSCFRASVIESMVDDSFKKLLA